MSNFDLLPKDILIELAIELDLPDIIKWCSLSKKFDSLTCKNDVFWRRKFIHDYGGYSKKSDLTWKGFYKFVTVTEPNDLLWEGIEGNILSYVVVSLKRGANVENGRRNYTPLSIASEKGHLEVVKYLVGQGADVRAQYDYALRYASLNGHLDIVKYLVDKGSYVSAEDDFALRYASNNGHLEVVKYLVEQGADVRAYDDEALRYASYYGHLEVVKYLVKQGADVRANNDYALYWAKQKNHFEIVNYLESLP